jgi:hypothetical protein
MRQHTNARDALAAIPAIPVVDLIACDAITAIENVQLRHAMSTSLPRMNAQFARSLITAGLVLLTCSAVLAQDVKYNFAMGTD